MGAASILTRFGKKSLPYARKLYSSASVRRGAGIAVTGAGIGAGVYAVGRGARVGLAGIGEGVGGAVGKGVGGAVSGVGQGVEAAASSTAASVNKLLVPALYVGGGLLVYNLVTK